MADLSASAAAAHDTDSDPELEVSLRIISPSSDLADFPILRGLSASTTVREVRAMVERELARRQRSTAGMRLIYQGRMFNADHKTLQDVIGNAALNETELHTLHLVLLDGGNSSRSTLNAPAIAHAHQTAPTHAAHAYLAATSQPAVAGPSGHNNPPHAALQARPFVHQHPHQYTPQPPYAPSPSDYALAAARHNAEARRAAVLDALRANPQPGFGVTQQPVLPPNLSPSAHLAHFFAATDGQPHGSTGPRSTPLYTASPILRHRHAPHHPGTVPPSMQGPFSNPPRNEPEVYILDSPSGPRALLINSTGTAYFSPAAPTAPTAPATTQGPRLGHYEQDQLPQAAQWTANELIREHNERHQYQNDNHLNLARQHVQHMEMLRELQQQHFRDPRGYPVAHNQATNRAVGAQHVQQQAPGFPPADGIPNFHANIARPLNGPVNNAGFLAAVWPQVWLVARLLLFIWWFTHPTASWTRWATVILLATAVFAVNTGMLDNVANRLWVPIRAHLDGLLPVGNPADEPEQANPAAPTNQNQNQNGARPAAVADRAGGAAPNPADVARRLVERRQVANGERLMNFARSLERFGILFLASLAPGIAERHVQMVEEQERRRLQRIREQDEAAAAAAAEAEAAAATAATAAAAAAAAMTEVEAEAEADVSATPTEKGASGDAEGTATGSGKPAAAADGVSVN